MQEPLQDLLLTFSNVRDFFRKELCANGILRTTDVMRGNTFMKFSSVTILQACLLMFAISGCTKDRGTLGSEENPIKLFFVPAVDAKLIEDRAKIVKEYLEENTPYKYQISIPSNFVAVVEAFGTSRADVSALNTFGYILAHEKYGVEAKLTVLRHGKTTYKSQIIAREDSKINKLEDLNGKRVAYVDPASTSGYLLPAKMFKDRNITPSEIVFANKHDNVVTMVYQGQVDAGATFYSAPADGQIQDARRLVKTQFPDVENKIKILELTQEIPNDPIVVRKDLPEAVKKSIVEGFLGFVKSEEGKKAFEDLYGVTDIQMASDKDYDGVRDMLKALGKSVNELVKK